MGCELQADCSFGDRQRRTDLNEAVSSPCLRNRPAQANIGTVTMCSYFGPLRQKIGVLALLIACSLTGLWARSLHVEDAVSFPTGDSNVMALISVKGEIGLMWWYDEDSLWPEGDVPQFSSQKFPPATPSNLGTWIWCCCGIGVKGWLGHRHYVVSHWSIIIPLTLLSAWLLLSKPYTVNPTPTLDPLEPTSSTEPLRSFVRLIVWRG